MRSMSHLFRGALCAALLAGLSGCANKMIPGTEIPDTDDTQAIIEVVNQYRQALERKDVDGVVKLLSEDFRDTAGTGTPADDLYYRDMREVLPTRFAKVENLRADFNIRTIDVDNGRAQVVYHFNTEYRLPEYKTKPVRNSDLQRMFLKKVDGSWKIVSGI